jgi:outer membrane protein OmpA-like peptidoglycan-associated protein
MNSPFQKIKSVRKPSEEHWVPLSDLMTGLMMLFMLIAVVFLIKVEQEGHETQRLKERAEDQAKKMQSIAQAYYKIRTDLYNDLNKAFEKDLSAWGAELNKDLTIRFKQPDVLFESQKSELKPRFSQILQVFFPRYIAILSSPKYRDSIEEIRIEGHTSSAWIISTSPAQAYMLNMALSQERTRSVLQYVLSLEQVSSLQEWLRDKLTANGLSSSKLIKNKDGGKSENPEASRRVEFRVRTNADARIEQLFDLARPAGSPKK